MENEQFKGTYMLLSRLEQDCQYFLGNGNGYVGHLWAGSVDGQYQKMKELYNSLPVDAKPEWLNMKQIDKYYSDMKNYIYFNKYEILQLNKDPESQKCLFMSSERIETLGVKLNVNMYNPVYSGDLKNYYSTTLNDLYEMFNIHRPEDFKGHSLSVSDVVVLSGKNGKKAFMVDDIGFKELGNDFFEKEKIVDEQKCLLAILSGEIVRLPIQADDIPLKTMQSIVGGYIEHVPLESLEKYNIDLWCNEDGKMISTNEPAIRLTQDEKVYDVVYGDCLFTKSDEDGNTLPLTNSEFELIKENLENSMKKMNNNFKLYSLSYDKLEIEKVCPLKNLKEYIEQGGKTTSDKEDLVKDDREKD